MDSSSILKRLALFLRNRFFAIPNVLAILCATFVDDSVSHFQLTKKNVLFEPDLGITSNLGFEFLDWVHRGHYQHFFLFRISYLHFSLSLRKSFLSCEVSSISQFRIPLQVYMEVSPFGQTRTKLCKISRSRSLFPLDKFLQHLKLTHFLTPVSWWSTTRRR